VFHHQTQLQGSGTVEARNISVGSKSGGASTKSLSGKVIPWNGPSADLRLNDRELEASLSQSRAQRGKGGSAFRPEEIAEARAAAAQAKPEYDQRRTATARGH